ncbi:hypothetical protein [Klebsiella grimontii]|uniref:hypothetical protein n=1 Tax=Klebsiella grimontii TaxID=2058152 RepID=UPI002930D6D0|nr:hypothetical protein [Klebsiella grimontii]
MNTIIHPVWVSFDPSAESGDSSPFVTVLVHDAVIYHITRSWNLHDFWIVNYKAFDIQDRAYFSDELTFNTAREAHNFKPGRLIKRCLLDPDSIEDIPF